MTPSKNSSSSSNGWAVALAVVAAAYVLWKLYGQNVFTSRSEDDDPNSALLRVPRRPTDATLPNGLPPTIASAMAASLDASFPKIEDSAVQVLHGDDEARHYAEDVVERMKLGGASVALISPDTAKILKFVDGKGVIRRDIEFLVYDVTETTPGYPSNQIVKLKAIYLAEPNTRAALYALNFATPREEKGGMDGFDATVKEFSRFESPLEVLRQMNFGPEAQVQT
jgi:hypothetical protein